MTMTRNIDDETDFELKKAALHGWTCPVNHYSIETNSFLVTSFSKGELPDGTFTASTHFRKTFNKHFNRNQVHIQLDIRGRTYEPLKRFSMYLYDDGADNAISIPIPEMNGQWHRVTAEITPKKDDLNTLAFSIDASASDIGSFVQIDNISVYQP
ncbi:hypothetical protein EI534_30550 [Pseudomonas frederiksbergensis]|nr:hypothetical protein [Pseudomonas frederiksbergensis]